MGFGGSSTQTHTQPNQPPQSAGFGFDFGTPPQSTPSVPATSAPQNNNLGFNFGTSTPPVIQSSSSQQSSGFQPITNTNPNKILAYENQHVQIWMDCIKEGGGSTKLFTTYINKTNNTITDLTIQAAVLKHVKLTINPLSSTTLQPYSKEVVHQVPIISHRQ